MTNSEKKPFYKKWWVWLIAIIIVVGVIGQDSDDNQTTSGESGTDQTTEAPAPGPAIGDTFTLGDFAYSITGVKIMKRVGNDIFSEEASTGASFVIIYSRMRNDGNETETVMTEDYRIVDQQGREFSPSSRLGTTLAMLIEDKDLIFTELQPGIVKDMTTGFEVPNDVVESGFTIVVPEKGFFGSDKVEISVLPSDYM